MFREIFYRLDEKLDRLIRIFVAYLFPNQVRTNERFTVSRARICGYSIDDKSFIPFFPSRRELKREQQFLSLAMKKLERSWRSGLGYIKPFFPFDRDSHDPDTFHSLAFCIVI